MLWLFVRPTGVYLFDFFCSGIQFYLLLSPCLCFISLLYLENLYILGDDALISKESFMQNFIKISKFALPSVMLKFKRTSKDR